MVSMCVRALPPPTPLYMCVNTRMVGVVPGRDCGSVPEAVPGDVKRGERLVTTQLHRSAGALGAVVVVGAQCTR